MTSKIFRSSVLLAVLVLLSSLGVVVGVLYNHFTQVQIAQLKDELSLAVTGTEQYGNAFLENVEADRFRITWIGEDGTVLFDTQADQLNMVLARIDLAALIMETAAVFKLKALETMQRVANGQATKIIIPSELQGLAGMASGVVSAVKDDK